MLQELLIPGHSAEWDEWVGLTPHDFYHTSAYHRFSELQGEGAAWVAVYGSRDQFVAWPYLLRPISGFNGDLISGAFDITSVYGYGGPVLRGCTAGDAFVSDALKHIDEIWRQQGSIAAFSRLHPLLQNHRIFSDESEAAFPAGETLSIDLTMTEDAAIRDYHRHNRQEIRRAREHGFETHEDKDWKHFTEFLNLYHATMARNRAARGYFFPAEYLLGLKRALGNKAVLMVTTLDGHVAAASIMIEYGGRVALHLEGTDSALLEFSPFKVLIDDMRRWGRERGNHTLHLGGGRGGQQDSLHAFKARFTKRRHSFWTFKKVLCKGTYRELYEARQAHAASVGLECEAGSFFPAYRAPCGEPLRISQCEAELETVAAGDLP